MLDKVAPPNPVPGVKKQMEELKMKATNGKRARKNETDDAESSADEKAQPRKKKADPPKKGQATKATRVQKKKVQKKPAARKFAMPAKVLMKRPAAKTLGL